MGRRLLVFDEFFEVFGNRFRHGLLVLAAASLFVHRVCPQHLARTQFNVLDGNVSLVLNPSARGEQAAGNFASGGFLLDLNGGGFQDKVALV